MPDNNTTAKFSVDISDLKKGIQEANRQIRLANAEFKAASASMDKWSNSTSGLAAKIEQTDKVLTQQKKILNSYKQEMEQVIAKYGENSKEADNAKIKYENQRAAVIKTQKALGDYKSALAALEKEQAESAKAAERQATAFESLEKTISGQENDLSALKSQYANVVLEQGRGSKAAKELASQISELSGELNDNKTKLAEAESAADEFDKSLEETTNGGLSVFTVALGNLAANVITDVIGKMRDMVAGSIEVGKAFDKSMSQVGAVSGATADELQALRDKAKEMGSTTKFTASEAADAFNYMAMAGWKTEDMLNGIDGILQLAAASGSDLATTSDIVTDALTAMGYSAKDAGRLSDVMAAASSNANTNVEMMGATFQYAAPIVGALGMNMEDTAVAVGLMANAGIKGEKAGTALRSILTRLSTDAGATANNFGALGTLTNELGVEFYNTNGTVRDLSDIINESREAWAGLSAEQQTSYGKVIAGQEALSGWLAIMNAAPEDVDKLTKAVEGADGAAEKMANTMLDNLGGDMTLLQSKLEGVQIAIYEKFEPALRDGVKVLDKLLDAVDFVVDHSAEFVAALGAMAAGVAAYVGYTTALKVMEEGWKALTIVTKAQTAAQWLLNAAMSANPIGIVIAAIVALVTAFVILWNKSEAFREFWIGLWEKVKEVAGVAWEAISGFFSDAWEKVKVIWGSVTDWFSEKWEAIKEIFSSAGDFIKEIWGSVTDWFSEKWEAIKEIFNAAGEFIKGIWDAAVNYILETFAPFINFFSTTIEIIQQLSYGCWLIIKKVWEIVSDWFKTNVIEPVAKFFSDLWEGLKQKASDAWDFIKSTWQSVKDWFKSNVIEPVSKFFTEMWDKLKKTASDTWDGIKAVWQTVKDWFKNTIIDPVSNFFTEMWQNLKKSASDAWNGIKSVFAPVAEWFESKFKKAWQKVKDVFSTGGKIFDGIKEGITDAFKAVVNAIIRGINKVIAIPFKAINSALDKIRDAEILGFKPFAGLISRFDIPQIPELARGGVLRRGQIALLEGRGAEAVVPLENNRKWIAATAKALQQALTNEGLIAAGLQQAPVINNNYSFVQNNSSPQALDRLSIYRDTNSLLFAAQNAR